MSTQDVDLSTPTRDHLCGVGRFRPRLLQVFAKPQVFTLVYSIALILQNAQFYYFFAIMSTLQRRYGLSSWSVAVILFADSASPFFISFAVGHYSRTVSKPLLLFWGVLSLTTSCCVSIVPYVIYGPGLAEASSYAGGSDGMSQDLCQPTAVTPSSCDSWMSDSVVVSGVLFAANCFYGAGYSVLYIAGSTYVDDSVKKKNSPLHFAFVAILKLVGPTLGYSLGSLCLQYYEDPRYDPGVQKTDPRWVGAWWLGYALLAVCLTAIAVPVLLFPKHLSPPGVRDPSKAPTGSSQQKPAETSATRIPEQSFWREIRSLFRNPVYKYRLVYWLLASNATLGHGMMSSKYIEVQFRTSASRASFIIGPMLLVTNVLGLGIGGLALNAFRPRARVVTSYTTFCDVLKLACLVFCMFIGCQGINLVGLTSMSQDGRPPLETACSAGCNCTTRAFQPICDPADSSIHFSPCFAGCRTLQNKTGFMSLEDCSCLDFAKREAVSEFPYLGLCEEQCQKVLLFIALTSLMGFITRTTTVGHTIVGLRTVARHEKAMALGVQEGLSSIFTYIPYPILYGAIFDWSCLVWEDKCGQPGVCWIYDTQKLRYAYHGLSSGILLLAVVFEVMMVYHSVRLQDFYDDATPSGLCERQQQQPPPPATKDETARMLAAEDTGSLEKAACSTMPLHSQAVVYLAG